MNVLKDFYKEGEYLNSPGVYSKVKLSTPCPPEGHVSSWGVCVATSPSKTAGLLWWPAVLAAVAWAAKRSPAIRADLRKILEVSDG